MQKLIAIIGPTASGKTALGEFLALQFNGEIVSADAKQVYKGMDLGTAKEKHLKVPQHLIDILEPGQKISVAAYQKLAYNCIDQILAQGKLPFLVGGSMMYASSVLEGYQFQGKGWKQGKPRYQTLAIGLEWDREALKQKAKLRLLERVESGLLKEVQNLLDQGVSPAWLKSCGLEYRYYTELALGECTASQAFEHTLTATNQYIKRQYTWWRHHGQVIWLQDMQAAAQTVKVFLG